ncbi:MAG: hypothetical protein HYT72_00030 [Candidatus Aenigmarchaeota archaeon]|nr:hypothetical protein [Candidatus Aenigmarchaeota archaeon]
MHIHFGELLKSAKRNKLKYMVFTREGQSTTSYWEYIERVREKKLNEVVNRFAGDLPLLR